VPALSKRSTYQESNGVFRPGFVEVLAVSSRSGTMLRGVFAVICLSGTAVVPARAEETYYVMVFGSQQTPPRPKYSHSFAIFVKATRAAANQCWALEAHTISWMPASMELRSWAFLPEQGRSVDPYTTFNWVLSTEQRTSMWGPYQVHPDLYDRAVRQIALLDSGQVEYKLVDSGYRSDQVSNCIHAVSSVVGGHRLRVLSPSFGETASYYIARRMEPWIIDCQHRHLWLLRELRLGSYPIILRDLESPQSSVLWSTLKRGLGMEEPTAQVLYP
jgi:hypothetical protein